MSDMKPLRVMVLDGDARQALPFLRSMRRHGHHVTVTCNTRLSPGYLSRYPNRRILLSAVCEKDPEGFYNQALEHLRTGQYDVVLPFGHYSIHLCVRHRQEIEKYAILPVAPTDLWMRAFDKAQTMAFCMKNNIPCPTTYFPEEEDLESILARATLPLWVKPGIGIGAIGGKRLDTPDEVRQQVPLLRQRHGPMILQEYIPHEGAQQMVYHSFLDGQGKTCAGMLSFKPRYFPIGGGTSTCLISIHRPEVVSYCRRLLEGIDFKGITDIDLIVDPRDGQAKVMEINPRVSCSVKIGFVAGIDYADMWLRLATGQPIEPKMDYAEGVVLRNLCQDILWYICSSRQARKATQPPWFKLWGKKVFYQTIARDDPFTFAGFVLNMLWKYSNREARREKLGH